MSIFVFIDLSVSCVPDDHHLADASRFRHGRIDDFMYSSYTDLYVTLYLVTCEVNPFPHYPLTVDVTVMNMEFIGVYRLVRYRRDRSIYSARLPQHHYGSAHKRYDVIFCSSGLTMVNGINSPKVTHYNMLNRHTELHISREQQQRSSMTKRTATSTHRRCCHKCLISTVQYERPYYACTTCKNVVCKNCTDVSPLHG